jgi:hypothetical protein
VDLRRLEGIPAQTKSSVRLSLVWATSRLSPAFPRHPGPRSGARSIGGGTYPIKRRQSNVREASRMKASEDGGGDARFPTLASISSGDHLLPGILIPPVSSIAPRISSGIDLLKHLGFLILASMPSRNSITTDSRRPPPTKRPWARILPPPHHRRCRALPSRRRQCWCLSSCVWRPVPVLEL